MRGPGRVFSSVLFRLSICAFFLPYNRVVYGIGVLIPLKYDMTSHILLFFKCLPMLYVYNRADTFEMSCAILYRIKIKAEMLKHLRVRPSAGSRPYRQRYDLILDSQRFFM